MKPLTIEELKALEVDDWVWIESDLDPNWNKFYAKKKFTEIWGSKYLELETQSSDYGFQYSDYRKTWLAYKNKEQAECQGEVTTTPCKIGAPIWVVYRDNDNELKIAETVCAGLYIDKNSIKIITNFRCYDYDRIGNFTDKSVAENFLMGLNKNEGDVR